MAWWRCSSPFRELISRGGLEMCDLRRDPEERDNLANRERVMADRHLRILAQMRASGVTIRAPLAPSEDRLDILSSPGYIE